MNDLQAQDVFEMWRAFNIALCVLGVVLNVQKVMIKYRLFAQMNDDERLGFLALVFMGLSYLGSTAVYLTLQGTAGPWTFIWTPSLMFFCFAGIIGRGRTRG